MTDHETILIQLAAKAAAKEMFSMLGVNVDDPQELEDFRRDLRFAGDLRRHTFKGIGAFVVAIVGAGVAAAWAALWHRFP